MAISQIEEFNRATNAEQVHPLKTLPQAGAGGDIEEVIYDSGVHGANDQGATLNAVFWAPSAAVVAVATNAYLLTIEQYAANGTTHKATLGTFDARTQAAGKFSLQALVSAEVSLAAGDKITYKLHQVGTGVAAPAGTLFAVLDVLSDEE